VPDCLFYWPYKTPFLSGLWLEHSHSIGKVFWFGCNPLPPPA
jgi:hypothetical protein